MKSQWVVVLVQPLSKWCDDFPANYFSRPFYYKAEALKLCAEVERKGGEAKVVRREKQS